MLFITVSFVIITSISLYARFHLSEASADPRALSGTWVNADVHAQGIKAVELRQDKGILFVRVWGACVPQNCDWGTQASDFSDNKVKAHWDLEGTRITLVLALRDDRLWLKATYQFNDGRAQERETDYLTRQR
jgi:hypothetical protein